MIDTIRSHLRGQLKDIEESGLYKRERIITSPQQARINVETGETVLNMCANNYLGLSNHPAIIEAAKEGIDQWGHGLSSVRFICGGPSLFTGRWRKKSPNSSKQRIPSFIPPVLTRTGGLFETLLTEEDAIFSDELNHG